MTEIRRGDGSAGARSRSVWRAVGLPTEHGGWGLTAEPVLLGMLVAPGVAGAALGGAAMLAFLARTPTKIALGDLRRGRRLERTRAAALLAMVEVVVGVALVALAVQTAESAFWAPLLLAGPLLGVELSYDIRAKGRRLVPELAGSVGIAAVATMIALAGGVDAAAAYALWALLAARAVTAIPFVRAQVVALHGRPAGPPVQWIADLVSLGAAVVVALVVPELLGGSLAVVGVVAVQRLSAVRPAGSAVVLGVRQTIMGLVVVLASWTSTVIAGGVA